jgi:hypothetical protein
MVVCAGIACSGCCPALAEIRNETTTATSELGRVNFIPVCILFASETATYTFVHSAANRIMRQFSEVVRDGREACMMLRTVFGARATGGRSIGFDSIRFAPASPRMKQFSTALRLASTTFKQRQSTPDKHPFAGVFILWKLFWPVQTISGLQSPQTFLSALSSGRPAISETNELLFLITVGLICGTHGVRVFCIALRWFVPSASRRRARFLRGRGSSGSPGTGSKSGADPIASAHLHQ